MQGNKSMFCSIKWFWLRIVIIENWVIKIRIIKRYDISIFISFFFRLDIYTLHGNYIKLRDKREGQVDKVYPSKRTVQNQV